MRQLKTTTAREKVVDTAGFGSSLYVDSTNLYWDEETSGATTSIFRMPLDGSSGPTRLAASIQSWSVSVAYDLITPKSSVYYVSNSQLASVPPEGGAATILAQDVAPFGRRLATDDYGVFWYDARGIDAGGGVLKTFAFATGSVVDLAAAQDVPVVDGLGTYVAWADEPTYLGYSTLWRASSQSDRRPIATNQYQVYVLRNAGGFVFWGTGDGFGSMGQSDIWMAPLFTGGTRKIVCQVPMLRGLAADNDYLYFSSQLGIGRVAGPVCPL
jgi:hypothetical protein